MLKQLSLCLLLTVNLYPADHIEQDKLTPIVVTAMILGVGIIGLDLYLFSNSERLEKLISGDEKVIGESIAKIITVITAGMGVLAIAELYPISKEIYEYTFPTEEQKVAQQADAIVTQANIQQCQAKINFRNCLMNSKSNSEENSSGCPLQCEELAARFIEAGGSNEVNRMTKVYNEF